MDVSLSSIGCRNEWFLVARRMFFCRVRVMDTELNTNKLKCVIRVAQPPESQLDRIRREIRQEQDSDTPLDQDFVAPAPCYMPIEVVSVRVREQPHDERMTSGAVSWTDG
jgi:hypothetical protein